MVLLEAKNGWYFMKIPLLILSLYDFKLKSKDIQLHLSTKCHIKSPLK